MTGQKTKQALERKIVFFLANSSVWPEIRQEVDKVSLSKLGGSASSQSSGSQEAEKVGAGQGWTDGEGRLT